MPIDTDWKPDIKNWDVTSVTSIKDMFKQGGDTPGMESEEIAITHKFMADGVKSSPVAVRHADGVIVDEMWVGSASNMNLLGVTSVVADIERDNYKDTLMIRFVFKINGVPVIEKIYEVNDNNTLGKLVRERAANIGEMK